MKTVEVAVGVIHRDGQIYITRRAQQLHQGGKWEFPGGKKEQGETVHQALCRELTEEVGIDVQSTEPLLVVEHDYGDKKVRLETLLVTRFGGEPYGREGQQGQWVKLNDLSNFDFPEANKAILQKVLEALA
ncbi:8-oxo-dGTP diphosphatase MutT [Neptunicella marina]|uniref:8-oxo-dGTP diphosphatase n=1 Tax=Neptunicella marina TaxID=2125989 RepID=A0A8J6M1B8_9ALTE|nr:8-oxo-dGTP diphosphatase MutT [Neptunicella marina]